MPPTAKWYGVPGVPSFTSVCGCEREEEEGSMEGRYEEIERGKYSQIGSEDKTLGKNRRNMRRRERGKERGGERGKERGREGEREREREGGREGKREGGRERGKERGREGGKKIKMSKSRRK